MTTNINSDATDVEEKYSNEFRSVAFVPGLNVFVVKGEPAGTTHSTLALAIARRDELELSGVLKPKKTSQERNRQRRRNPERATTISTFGDSRYWGQHLIEERGV